MSHSEIFDNPLGHSMLQNRLFAPQPDDQTLILCAHYGFRAFTIHNPQSAVRIPQTVPTDDTDGHGCERAFIRVNPFDPWSSTLMLTSTQHLRDYFNDGTNFWPETTGISAG